MQKVKLCLIFIAIGLYACSDNSPSRSSEAESDKPLFDLLSISESGIDFRNNLLEDIYSRNNILSFEYYYHGGGVAIGDINNDGRQDIFFTGNTADNKLFLNKGKMKFEDISSKAGINVGKNWATGVSMVDINNDGWLDIYVCQAGPSRNLQDRQNRFYINNGDLTFTEQGTEMGLNDTNLSIQSAFLDYDKDGDLDCFVMSESKYFRVNLNLVFADIQDKQKLREASSKLFRNDGGKFVDVTESAGMLKYGYGLGLAVSDINDDGWPDVYVVNDYSVPDFMYINQKNGRFVNEIKKRTKQISWFGMGIDIADVNNDGQQDIAIVDMASKDHFRSKTLMAPMNPQLFSFAVDTMKYQFQYMYNSLQLNHGDNTYSNAAFLAGVGSTEWSWASLLADFDNDGFRDYFVTNGSRRYYRDNDFRNKLARARVENGGNVPNELRQKLFDEIPQIKLSNLIYKNDGDLHFSDHSKAWGIDHPSYSNGAAYGDLDGDGDLDLVVSNIDDVAHVYRNNTSNISKNNWLRVRLESGEPKAGTKVRIYYGDQQQVAEYGPVRGFQSSVEDLLHFGLGDVDRIDRVVVQWPNGKMETVDQVSVNKILKLNLRNANEPIERIDLVQQSFKELRNQLDFVHKENTFNDFEREVLLPYKQSTLGPFLSKADVNGDGLEDIFIGGAKGQSAALFLQTESGFQKSSSQPWSMHASSEDMGSHFFDADGDGDMDLYVTSGGNEFEIGSKALLDRMYINNGSGRFSYQSFSLPDIGTTTMQVISMDYDDDGDNDLVVGGRHKPRNYPIHERSYLLQNNGNGGFTDVTESAAPELLDLGLVNDLHLADIDQDGVREVLVAVEWNSLQVFKTDGKVLTNITKDLNIDYAKGWWFSVTTADVDNDGDEDIIAGNLGLNSKFSATEKKPFNVFAGDFDQNGICDVVLSKEYKGRLVPTRGRQCSSEQMPFIKENFPTYTEFANASVEEILGDEIENSLKLQATELRSMVFINEGGSFVGRSLPPQAQISSVYSILPDDYNADGHVDILLAGNLYGMEIETPRLDAGKGLLLLGDGSGQFTPIGPHSSGFRAERDVKDMVALDMGVTGQKNIIVANNNGPIEIFTHIPSTSIK